MAQWQSALAQQPGARGGAADTGARGAARPVQLRRTQPSTDGTWLPGSPTSPAPESSPAAPAEASQQLLQAQQLQRAADRLRMATQPLYTHLFQPISQEPEGEYGHSPSIVGASGMLTKCGHALPNLSRCYEPWLRHVGTPSMVNALPSAGIRFLVDLRADALAAAASAPPATAPPLRALAEHLRCADGHAWMPSVLFLALQHSVHRRIGASGRGSREGRARTPCLPHDLVYYGCAPQAGTGCVVHPGTAALRAADMVWLLCRAGGEGAQVHPG